MFLPNYFRYVQARPVYGNVFPKDETFKKTHQHLQFLSQFLSYSQEALMRKALVSQKEAIWIFCHPNLSEKLSLCDIIEIFLFYPLLAKNIINNPVFQDFSKNVTQEEFKHYFQNKRSAETFKEICDITGVKLIGFNFTEESHALIYELGKMLSLVDFGKINDVPTEDCLKLLKKMLAMPFAFSDELRSKLTRILNALSNTNFIRELNELDATNLMLFARLFERVASEVLETPQLLDKLSAKQLETLCVQHQSVADKVITTEKLLRKTLVGPNVENEKLMLQQAKLASSHYAIVDKLFHLFSPAFCPPYPSSVVTEQYGLCLFFLGKQQPSIAKKILTTPYLCYLLNGCHVERLERTVALWETMKKLCIELASSPASDPSLEAEISSKVGKLKIE